MEFENSIWHFYHESSKDKSKGHPPIPYDSNLWPESWKTVHYKSYARLPKLSLPSPQVLPVSLSEALSVRHSHRDFLGEPMPLQKLADVLYWACAVRTGTNNRPYPSGGGRFPVELYVLNLQTSDEFASGVYHYDLKAHSLDQLWKKEFTREELEELFGYPWAKKASVLIVMTGVFHRTVEKYGERGYRFVLLEAGHIGQNIALASEALGLRSCSLGGVNEQFIESLLDIDPKQESAVYSIVLGT